MDISSESLFNTLLIEIKRKCLKNFLRRNKFYKKYPLFPFASSNASQF